MEALLGDTIVGARLDRDVLVGINGAGLLSEGEVLGGGGSARSLFIIESSEICAFLGELVLVAVFEVVASFCTGLTGDFVNAVFAGVTDVAIREVEIEVVVFCAEICGGPAFLT